MKNLRKDKVYLTPRRDEESRDALIIAFTHHEKHGAAGADSSTLQKKELEAVRWIRCYLFYKLYIEKQAMQQM